MHNVFELARRNAPCVLFLDEVDARGHKRSQMAASTTMRTVVNQLLNEMDSVGNVNLCRRRRFGGRRRPSRRRGATPPRTPPPR
ncbi:AAA family ATPase [Nocardia sp. NPDC005366]|uniref:AAA family ATPase n=1 Tax=Nocardia sp. NPDC005366 TaxID=3156878 RepID=UPI0033AC2C2E